MLEATSFARIVLTTAANAEEAGRLGRALVEERLAACATVLPGRAFDLSLAEPN